MDSKDYYKAVFDKLKNPFQFSHYVLAYGVDLRLRDIAEGRQARSETALPITVEPIANLWDLTANWGLEVFVPIVGFNSQAILSSLDYEIYLDDQSRLYADRGSQQHYFDNYIGPVTDYIANILERFKIPFMTDITPSGGHFLFWIREGTKEWDAVADIGYLEPDLRESYSYHDHNDLKRNPPVSENAGLVYSGLGRLWEYVARLAIRDVRTGAKELPLTLSDPENKSVNLDITQYSDPAFMRIMRSPFSLHKKRAKYIPGAEPLVDVPLWYYDGISKIGDMNFEHILKCMWDLETALKHSSNFTGFIPCANENLVKLVDQYKCSKLYKHHSDIDWAPKLKRQEAFSRAVDDPSLDEKTRSLLTHPNPRAMDPKALTKFIDDLRHHGWCPSDIGCLISDLYEQPQHLWNTDWFKYPSRTRGNFWARVYTGPTEI